MEQLVKGPNRRGFLKSAAALAPLFGTSFGRLLAHAAAVAEPGRTLFVGHPDRLRQPRASTPTRGDPQAGTLKLQGIAATTPMPTFLVLSADKRILFTANETDSFKGAKVPAAFPVFMSCARRTSGLSCR